MSCELIRQSLLDEGGAGTEGAAHLEACGDCRDFVASLEPLRRVLSDAVEAPPERVWQRLRADVVGSAPARRQVWTRRLISAAAAAAALLAVVMTWPGPTRDSGPEVTPSPPALVRASTDAVDPSLSALAGPGREDADLRDVRFQLDYMKRDVSRF